METKRILVCLIAFFMIVACKSTVKKQNDKVYSRHLQRSVDITIIATKMPDKKEEMNLLLLINNDLVDENEAKDIVDSLYKNKKIQPVILISFKGTKGDYGLEELQIPLAKQYKKFNAFVVNELYPFVKKKTTIRRFNSVAIVGSEKAALAAFDIGWNNDEKIEKVGMLETDFSNQALANDSLTLSAINSLRKRPNLRFWQTSGMSDSAAVQFKNNMAGRKSIQESRLLITPNSIDERNKNFAAFLVWAFHR